MILRWGIAVIALWVASSSTTWAAVLEVGPGQTYTTITACHAAAIAGDTCNIHAGSYTENVTVSKSMTFQNNSGESPVLTGDFNLGSTANVTLTCNNGGGAMQITGYGTPSVADAGIYQSGGTGLTVTGCVVHSGYGAGIYTRNSTKVLLQDNHVYGTQEGAAGLSATGITIVSGHSTDGTYANGVSVTNNVIHDNDVDGLDIHGQYFTVSGNNIYNNITTNWATTHPDGIQIIASTVDSYSSVQHAKIFNNTIKNSTQLIFGEGTLSGEAANCEDVWIFNNVLYNDSGIVNGVDLDALSLNQVVLHKTKNTHVYNNTFGRSKGNGIYALDGASGSLYIKNNIFKNTLGNGMYIVDTGQIPSGGLNYNHYDITNNVVVWGASFYATLAAFQAAVPTQELQGQDGDPLIESFPTPIPQYGSAAINAGVDLSGVCPECATDKLGVSRPYGSAWDIGAYEYVSGGGGNRKFKLKNMLKRTSWESP